ncbi:putative ribonuclease H-like domain-containing protein, partial [Tanacetum coccineum]
ANQNASTKENIDAVDSPIEAKSAQDYFVLLIWSFYTSTVKSLKASEEPIKHPDIHPEALRKEFAQETEDLLLQAGVAKASSTNIVNTASTPVSTASPYDGLSFTDLTNTDQDDLEIPALKEIYTNPTDGIFTNSSYDDDGAVADFTNLEPVVNVSPIPSSRINSIHPSTQILGDPQSAVQTRSKVTKSFGAYAFKISEALEDESWVDAMQEELLQFKIQKVWILVDLPYGKKAIGTKWVYRNKKDERGVVVRNKARIFLAFVSYMGFIVYQMDVKSAFLYGKIDEEVYVSQPPGFIDPKYPKKDLRKSNFNEFYGRAQLLSGLQVKPDRRSTPIETQKPLAKDEEASDVDVHLYRFMIGSLMYLTASSPDIMYLKGKPKLGLWYPRVSSFDLEAYSDSDYVGANLDRKSTTGGCQFLGRRLISWQCKKHTIVATSTTEAKYIAAANCCGQVLWIQNQMLDYGFNFMNTKIYIDNESTIRIVKNPVYHSKTKHIAIRHHFIRDAYEKKLIQVLQIHTDDNVADLLTKAFDVSRFQFLVVTIGMINP